METITTNLIKKDVSSWIKSVIIINVDIYVTESKTCCELIQDITPQDNNNQSHLNQNMIHEVIMLKKHAKNISQKTIQMVY